MNNSDNHVAATAPGAFQSKVDAATKGIIERARSERLATLPARAAAQHAEIGRLREAESKRPAKFDPDQLRAIAENLRALPKLADDDWRRRGDYERIARRMLSEAFEHGAFDGPRWTLWRHSIIEHTSFESAVATLDKLGADVGVPKFWSGKMYAAVPEGCPVLAELIEAEAGRLAGAASLAVEAANDDPILNDSHRCLLVAMLDLKAVDSDHLRPADEIVVRAFGRDAFANDHKKPLADLVRFGLAASKRGRGGGSWLTPAGIERAGMVSTI